MLNQLSQKLKGLAAGEPLANYTTFKLGGPAEYLYRARCKEDVLLAVKTAKEMDIPYFVLGGGSNLLVSDMGFEGLVIKLEMKDFRVEGVDIIAEAGANLMDVVKASAEEGLSGLEFAAGIYGTVGGAVRGNAGAFGGSMSDVVEKAVVLSGGQVIEYNRDQLGFVYRESIFKLENNHDIILEVHLALQKGDSKESEKLIKKYLDYRKEKQPLECPSAGCIFKNIEAAKEVLSELKPKVKEKVLRHIVHDKIPAAYLIELSGCKGIRVGGSEVSAKHANFVVNRNNATANDVYKLIQEVKKCVLERTGIGLEEEVMYLGF